MNNPRKVVGVSFGNGDRVYDYFADDHPVEVGQTVIVETSRGEKRVKVVEVKDGSDRAEKSILRIHADDETDEQSAA